MPLIPPLEPGTTLYKIVDCLDSLVTGINHKYPAIGKMLDNYLSSCRFDGNTDSVEQFLLVATLGLGAAFLVSKAVNDGKNKKILL
jgi:hypothetical protein